MPRDEVRYVRKFCAAFREKIKWNEPIFIIKITKNLAHENKTKLCLNRLIMRRIRRMGFCLGFITKTWNKVP
jgi:hypothetical protein